VLELDAGAFGRLRGEADFDLAGLLGVGLDLPLGADVPAEHEPVGRLIGEHPDPVALAAVDAAVVDVAASACPPDVSSATAPGASLGRCGTARTAAGALDPPVELRAGLDGTPCRVTGRSSRRERPVARWSAGPEDASAVVPTDHGGGLPVARALSLRRGSRPGASKLRPAGSRGCTTCGAFRSHAVVRRSVAAASTSPRTVRPSTIATSSVPPAPRAPSSASLASAS
jgi:hypothetical protein